MTSISLFPEAMPKAARASIKAADALRALRDSTGDMPFNLIEVVQGSLGNAKSATYDALSEGNKQPIAAEAFMASIVGPGGPATLAEFQTSAFAIETKAAAWNVALEAAILSMTSDELIGMAIRGVAPKTYKMPEYKGIMPAAKADALRASVALSDLITAFESVGA